MHWSLCYRCTHINPINRYFFAYAWMRMNGQYLLQGREGALLLLLQGLDLLQQTASLQTQPSDLLKHLLILRLTETATKKNAYEGQTATITSWKSRFAVLTWAGCCVSGGWGEGDWDGGSGDWAGGTGFRGLGEGGKPWIFVNRKQNKVNLC